MVSVTIYLALAVIGIIAYFFIVKKNNKKGPPGPIGLPIFGNVLQLGSRPHLVLAKMAKKYGSLLSVNFGPNKTIVISDPKLVKEIFNDPVFSGRPQDDLFLVIPEGAYGVLNSEKETWESQRRFALRHLRDFGFGKSSLEFLISEEAKEVIENFKLDEGKPIVANHRFSLAVLNSLWTILTGTRNSQDDPKLTSLLSAFNKLGTEFSESGIFLFAPWLLKLAPKFSKYDRFLKIADDMAKFIRDTLVYHKKTLPEQGHPRDFIDAYLHEIQKTENKNSTFYKEIGEKNLFAMVSDFFQAGSATTSATLAWTMLFLGGHQDIQKKLQAEIDEVIGKSRLPSLADKASMPYMEAVTMEISRMGSIIPLGVFHTALADKEFHGYEIKKGSWLNANIWGIHHDPQIWGDPHTFRPERFLSSDGKTVEKNEALMPFLIGKRQCIGISLAQDTLFIFTASIFQRFNVKIHLPNGGEPDYEAQAGFLANPKKYQIILKDRLA